MALITCMTVLFDLLHKVNSAKRKTYTSMTIHFQVFKLYQCRHHRLRGIKMYETKQYFLMHKDMKNFTISVSYLLNDFIQ